MKRPVRFTVMTALAAGCANASPLGFVALRGGGGAAGDRRKVRASPPARNIR